MHAAPGWPAAAWEQQQQRQRNAGEDGAGRNEAGVAEWPSTVTASACNVPRNVLHTQCLPSLHSRQTAAAGSGGCLLACRSSAASSARVMALPRHLLYVFTAYRQACRTAAGRQGVQSQSVRHTSCRALPPGAPARLTPASGLATVQPTAGAQPPDLCECLGLHAVVPCLCRRQQPVHLVLRGSECRACRKLVGSLVTDVILRKG